VSSTSEGFLWQPSLFVVEGETDFDGSFGALKRIQLDEESWVDHAPNWVTGADALFEEIIGHREWNQRSRHMYDKRVLEPRLTDPWHVNSGNPLEPAILEEIRQVLSTRYQRDFDSVGFNLYRDGNDSVAWHSDKIRKEIDDPIVVLVSLGEPRRFLLRPKVGGKSIAFMLGQGDLFVTGGRSQRTWEHSVPKVKQAGPRISLAYRHGMDPAAYSMKRIEKPGDPEGAPGFQ
jgi:alkylated DNA repair dioxygenase AlkB